MGSTETAVNTARAETSHDVVVSQPVYEKNDPNCCPTGGFDHERWHWSGKRFVVARSWHTRSYRP